ncbi:hypothetical protein Tco_0348166 [Tanacetum coccineum]
MNEDYYHEQNSCYDYKSFGFDQFQPPQYTVNHPISNVQNSLFNAQNELLNSQNKLMEQMTSICDLAGQIIQKKEEEKRIAEEQVAKDRYWKIPICYDDDEDDTIAITPVSSSKEPVDSLIIEDEHLDILLATESDKVIMSSVEILSHPIVSLEVVAIVIPEVGGIDDDYILLHLPMLCKSSSTSLNLFLEETNTFDNSLTESKTFCFNLEEISSGSTITRFDYSLPDYEAFYDDILKRKSSASTTTHADYF